jgi:hypothetical protein
MTFSPEPFKLVSGAGLQRFPAGDLASPALAGAGRPGVFRPSPRCRRSGAEKCRPRPNATFPAAPSCESAASRAASSRVLFEGSSILRGATVWQRVANIRAPLMELPCLSESSSARRTGYSVHRSLLGICPREKACPRGLPTRATPCSYYGESNRDPLTDFGPLQRLPRAPSPLASTTNHFYRGAPPMRFSAPPAFKHGESASKFRFHPEHHPSTAFLRPLRV